MAASQGHPALAAKIHRAYAADWQAVTAHLNALLASSARATCEGTSMPLQRHHRDRHTLGSRPLIRTALVCILHPEPTCYCG